MSEQKLREALEQLVARAKNAREYRDGRWLAFDTSQEEQVLAVPVPEPKMRLICPLCKHEAQEGEYVGVVGCSVCNPQKFYNSHVPAPEPRRASLDAIKEKIHFYVGSDSMSDCWGEVLPMIRALATSAPEPQGVRLTGEMVQNAVGKFGADQPWCNTVARKLNAALTAFPATVAHKCWRALWNSSKQDTEYCFLPSGHSGEHAYAGSNTVLPATVAGAESSVIGGATLPRTPRFDEQRSGDSPSGPQTTSEVAGAADYKPAWEEINRVYDRAVKLLPESKYLGWNWVHALVCQLERLTTLLTGLRGLRDEWRKDAEQGMKMGISYQIAAINLKRCAAALDTLVRTVED